MGRIDSFLRQREENNLKRILKPATSRGEGKIRFGDREYIDLSSNDYLGLSTHPALKEASKKALDLLGTGASASRLLSGDLKLHHELEEKIALFKGKEKALVFNSGYQANVGVISSLVGKGDVVFADKLSHASIIDGILLSGARLFRFHHNDTGNLETLLKKERAKFKEALIITETIFSMDGDKAPLKEIVSLKNRYSCAVLVDEAHATGIFGENGSGVVEEEGLVSEIDLIMGTFSKALGSFGAYIAGTKRVMEYLINLSRSFIYSTALPPSVISANIAALELIKAEPFRRHTLLKNSQYLRCELKSAHFDLRGSSQIIPIVLGDNEKTCMISKAFQDKGFWVLPIRPPTVPRGESRLRFSLTYHHDKEILTHLLKTIKEL